MKSKLVTCLGIAPVTNTDGQDTSGSHTAGSKTPGGAGHTRQTHEPHKTEPPQNNLNAQNQPTHRLARQTTTEPRDARVATNRTTHPIKRGGGDGDVATAPR